MKKKVTQFVKNNKVISIGIVFLILISLGGLVIYLAKKPEKKKKAKVKKPPVKKPLPKVQVKTTVVEEPEPAPEPTRGSITGLVGPVGFGSGGGGGSGGASYDRSAENAANAAKYKSKRESAVACRERADGGKCIEKDGEYFVEGVEDIALRELEDIMVEEHQKIRTNCNNTLPQLTWDESLSATGVDCFPILGDQDCNTENVFQISFGQADDYDPKENYYELALDDWKDKRKRPEGSKKLFNNFEKGHDGNNFFCVHEKQRGNVVSCVYGNQIIDPEQSGYIDYENNFDECD